MDIYKYRNDYLYINIGVAHTRDSVRCLVSEFGWESSGNVFCNEQVEQLHSSMHHHESHYSHAHILFEPTAGMAVRAGHSVSGDLAHAVGTLFVGGTRLLSADERGLPLGSV